MFKKTIRGAGGGGKSGGGSIEPNSVQSDSLAKWICLVCEGPILGFGPEPINAPLGGVYLNNVKVVTNPLEYQTQDLTWNFRFKDFEFRYGSSTQTVMPNFSDVEDVQVIGTQVYNTTPVTVSTSGPGIDSLIVTVGFGALEYTDPNSGDVTGTSVEVQVWIQPFGGAWILAVDDTVNEISSGPYMLDYQFPLPDNTLQYNVKVVRVTPDSNQANLQNTTFFASITEIQNVQQYYPNSVLAGFYVDSKYFGSSMPQCGFEVYGLWIMVPSNYYCDLPVTSMTNANPGTVTITGHGIPLGTSNFAMSFYGPSGWTSYLNGVTFDLCSVVDANTISLGTDTTNAPPYADFSVTTGNALAYVGAWNGTFKDAYSNNGAWVFFDMLANNRYGIALPWSMIDQWKLYTIAQYNDGIVPDGYGGFERRYTFNGSIAKRDNAWKQLALIASNFQCTIYNSDNGVGFIQDCYKAPSQYAGVAIPGNVIAGQFSYSGSAFSDRYTVCLVHWNNPDLLWGKDIEVVEDKAGILQYGWNQVEITAMGCTSRGMAHRKGAMLLDAGINSTEIVTYRGGFDHILLMPGDIVQVMDPAYAGARFGGRIIAFTDTGTDYEITLDAPVTFVAGTSYDFSCIVPNSEGNGFTTQTSGITTVTGEYSTINVAYNSWSLVPSVGLIWTISNASGAGIAPRPFMIVDKKEVGEITSEITGVLYDPTKYARVEQNLPNLQPSMYSALVAPIGTLPTPSNLEMNMSISTLPNGSYDMKSVLSWEAIGVTSSSTTSATIGIGQHTLTISTGLLLSQGQRIRFADASSQTQNWMEGVISSYQPETGALVFSADTIVGGGTFTSWSVSQQSANVAYYNVAAQSCITGEWTQIGKVTVDHVAIPNMRSGWYNFFVEAYSSVGSAMQYGTAYFYVGESTPIVFSPQTKTSISSQWALVQNEAVPPNGSLYASAFEFNPNSTQLPALLQAYNYLSDFINSIGLLSNMSVSSTITGLSGNIPVEASPMSWVNLDIYWAAIQISGGDVSSVTVNGTQVATATNTVVAVPNGATLVVTYTSAPVLAFVNYSTLYSDYEAAKANLSQMYGLSADALITSKGISAGIANQGVLATQNNAAWGTQITGVPGNLASLNGTEFINNADITINSNGEINGIGTGSGTIVDNNSITIGGGALNGIGTGSGTIVDNNSITIGSNYELQGIGSSGGYVPTSVDPNGKALIDFGQTGHLNKILDNIGDGNSYKRVAASTAIQRWLLCSQGYSATIGQHGIYLNGTLQYNTFRSYNVVVIDRATMQVVSFTSYDVYGSATNAANMANALNALTTSSIVLITTCDEPQTNRLANGLVPAMYRCGASAVFASVNFMSRGAYILAGIPGIGQGNGIELYSGAISNDTNAYCETAVSIIDGEIQGLKGTLPYAFTQDELPDGSNYQRVQGTALTNGEIDLSKAGVINKNTSYLTDGAGLGETANWGQVNSRPDNLSSLSGTEVILNTDITIDDTFTIQGIGTGTGTYKVVSEVDINAKAIIDLSQPGHIAIGGLPPGNLNVYSSSSTEITITCGPCNVHNSSGTIIRQSQTLSSITVNLAQTGALGLDAGSLSPNTTYYVYCIFGAFGTTFLASTSKTAPSLPPGYTYYGLISFFLTNSSSQVLKFNQGGDLYNFSAPQLCVSTSSNGYISCPVTTALMGIGILPIVGIGFTNYTSGSAWVSLILDYTFSGASSLVAVTSPNNPGGVPTTWSEIATNVPYIYCEIASGTTVTCGMWQVGARLTSSFFG